MNMKKPLQNRIRGWFPKEPKMPRTANSQLYYHFAQKQTLLPVAGGALTIIGSFIVFLMGVFQIIPFGVYVISIITGASFNVPNVFTIFGFGCVNIFCFVTAFKSGSLAIQRKRYKFSIAGPILLSVGVLMTTILMVITEPFPVAPALEFGLPLATLSILSLVLIGLSRKEFEPHRDVV